MATKNTRYKLLKPDDLELDEFDHSDNDEKILFERGNQEHSSPEVQIRKADRCSKCRNFTFVSILITSFIIVIYFLITSQQSYDEWKDYFNQRIVNNYRYPTNEWSVEMPTYGTESCIRLFDINEDGLDDIIFGLATTDEINKSFEDDPKKIVRCGGPDITKDCQGLLYGVRGYDGKILWKFTTKSEVFELNCHSIDVNRDGKLDCLASGRRKTFLAFDPRTGKVLWESHSYYYQEHWNTYNPLVIPFDLDEDGVNEIVIAHGGNPTIPSNVRKRESGRIIVVSGKTGKVLGECFLLPDDKETYMSPVLHKQKDGSLYLLLGSGGETVPGSLYLYALPNFYEFTMYDEIMIAPAQKKKFPGKYEALQNLSSIYPPHRFLKGLFTLYTSKSKGVMVPPVLADVNNDGTKDILMSSFDGTLILYDGETFEKIWSKEYACHETYTSPAPGYYNDDDVPDFMLAQNFGAFDYYRSSTLHILNGKDGSVLWEMKGPRMQMISPLTIRTTEMDPKRDFYFYRVQGIEVTNASAISHQVYHGIEPQQPMQKPKKRETVVEKPIPRRKRHAATAKLPETTPRNLFVKNAHQTLAETCPDDLFDESGKEKEVNHDIYKPKCYTEFDELYLSTYGVLMDRTLEARPLVVFQSKPTFIQYSYTKEDVEKSEALQMKFKDYSGNNYGSTCVIMEPMERNTGAIGDLDGDNVPDVVTIITRAGIVNDNEGHYVKILTEMYLTKKNLRDSFKREQYLQNTDESITIKQKSQSLRHETNLRKLSFMKNQTWSAYMGYKSDSAFNSAA